MYFKLSLSLSLFLSFIFMHLLFLPCLLHDSSINPNVMKRTIYEAHRYLLLPTLSLFIFSCAPIFLSAVYFQTLLLHVNLYFFVEKGPAAEATDAPQP
jgi:hypothetical protein